MPVSLNHVITQADMDALALLANTKLLPLVNAAIAANYAGASAPWGDSSWAYDDDGSGNGLLTVFTGVNVYDIPATTTVAGSPSRILNPQPAYVFDITKKNWRDELNRVRGDFYTLIYNNVAGASGIFRNVENILSGPWIVDVNDPDTFPRFYDYANYPSPTLLPMDGVFMAGDFVTGYSLQPCWFKDVAFYFAEKDVPLDDLTITAKSKITIPFPAFVYDTAIDGTGLTASFTVICDFAGTVDIALSFDMVVVQAGLGGAPYPTTATTTPAATSYTVVDTGVTYFSGEIIKFTGTWTAQAVAAGANEFTIFIPTTSVYGVWGGPASGGFSCLKVIESKTGSTVASAIHPISNARVQQMTVNEKVAVQTDSPAFLAYAISTWELSDVDLKGCWSAKTLPVPGINFYLDQDMPPFVGDIILSASAPQYQVAIGSNIGDGDFLASAMRQQTVGDENAAKFGKLKSSLAARPTPYQVLRDTDFVPWDYGFANGAKEGVYITSSFALADGTLTSISSGSIFLNATNFKLRIVKYGTAKLGWKSGIFQYGEPLATTFNLYVKHASQPTKTDYDFKATANDLTINPDGGGSYLAAVLNSSFWIGIENTSGADVQFDYIIETDTVPAPSLTHPPAKQYFPVARECFSYCITDIPSVLIYQESVAGNQGLAYGKPIPQNGYCIFKLRATRLPALNPAGIAVTPASGPSDIIIKVGQNLLQPDNTLVFTPLKTAGSADYTITIPMAARDSGDVAVFWPVLGGNELVYQCSERVIFEAWANWQPIFFNQALGYSLVLPGGIVPSPTPTQFTAALGFVNLFAVIQAGYPTTTTERPAPWNQNVMQVQYPPSIEIYNDLEAVLNLI